MKIFNAINNAVEKLAERLVKSPNEKSFWIHQVEVPAELRK